MLKNMKINLECQYEQRLICYVDILGFSNLVKDGLVAPATLNLAIKMMNSIANTHTSDNQTFIDSKNVVVTQFSDNLVISAPANDPSGCNLLLTSAMMIHMSLLQLGILCRGAILFGDLFHNNSAVFGPGLVKVHNLESKCAIYPRIIFGREVFDFLKLHNLVHLLLYTQTDLDGFYYLNYIRITLDSDVSFINSHIHELRSIITQNINDDDPGKVQKYIWLAQRHNDYMNELAQANLEGLDFIPSYISV